MSWSVLGFVPIYFLKEDRTMPRKYSPEYKARALQLIEEWVQAE